LKRAPVRDKHRSDYNNKIDLKEIKGEIVGWIHLDQEIDQWWALVNTVMDIRVPYNTEYFLTS
jgi:hypothetical protein